MLSMPKHFDPSRVGEVRMIKYLDLASSAEQWADAHRVPHAATDKSRVVLLPIDCQNTFCLPQGELYVAGRSGTGALDDIVRLCKFVYANLDVITEIHPTLDTHFAMQIFHPIFWVDAAGKHPAPGVTVITVQDVERGVWRVNPKVAYSLVRQRGGTTRAHVNGMIGYLEKFVKHYVKELSDGGKYPLLIWPYHAMLGGVGHALVASLEEAIFFHNIARYSQTGFEVKGGNPLTENYSVLRPEVQSDHTGQSIAQKNVKFIETLLTSDVVIIAGQAMSHCVAWTIQDLLDEIMAKDKSLVEKVYLLRDCTSPVVIPGAIDFTDQAVAAFDKFANAGMNIVDSTTPIRSWPGVASQVLV